MKSEKKTLRKRIRIIITVLLIFTVVSMVATKFIYDAIFTRYDAPAEPVPQQLAQMVAQRQTQEYPCGENMLTGYLYRSEAGQAGLVVLTPGYRAGADDYLWQIKDLLEGGWSVFAFDATGSCSSEGESAVGFAQILNDLDATLKYVEKCDRFGYNELVLFGHSRGGYAACCALGYDYEISAVISVSGVNSAMEGVMGSATEYVGPLAYGNYGFLWLYQTCLFGNETANMCADEEISQSDTPVLIVHGTMDEQVPMEQYSIISHRDEITSDAVEYYLCNEPAQNGHTDLLFDADGTANDALMEKIHGFLSEHTD